MLRELMAIHQWTCYELNQEMSEPSVSINQPDQFSNVWHFARHNDIQRRAKEWAAGAVSRPPARNVPINKTPSILVHEGSLGEIVYSINGSVPTKSIRLRSVLGSLAFARLDDTHCTSSRKSCWRNFSQLRCPNMFSVGKTRSMSVNTIWGPNLENRTWNEGRILISKKALSDPGYDFIRYRKNQNQ